MTGEFCDKYPEDVKKFYDAGHEIANHSDKHPHVEGMNINDLIADTKACEQKIEKITGKKPTLYRGPYGEYDDNMLTTLDGMGYMDIQWSVDSIDWEEPDAATIRKRILDNTESGSILLFHNDLANTTEALPEILSKLKQQGFDFVTVSDMIYRENYHIDRAGKQIYDVNVSESAFISYTNNQLANQALVIAAENLTSEEMTQLALGNTSPLEKIMPLLSAEQFEALSEIDIDELRAIYAEILAQQAESVMAEAPALPDNEINELYADEVPQELLEYPPLTQSDKGGIK